MNSPTMTEPVANSTAGSTHALSGSYNLAVGYLRGFVTLLVLAHHAVLAYHPFAPPTPATLVTQPRWWQAFPVVDPQRWSGFSLFVGFNDIFFMSLMFFLSGLFVFHSIERKGVKTFLRDRLLRLGLPFVVAAAVIAPLAYYPAYLQTTSHTGFWQQWMGLGNWPAGPAWFIWLLLAFDVVAAALFVLAPRFVSWMARITSDTSRHPIALLGLIVAVTAVAYIPMAMRFTTLRWSAFGPFTLQTSRLFHYLAYFLIAVGVGAYGLQGGLFARDGRLARRWPLWTGAMVLFFLIATGALLVLLSGKSPSLPWELLLNATFVLSCAASCFGLMSLFARFATRRVAVFDSLTENAYGMYLIHYAFVSWLQYALLPSAMPAIAKGTLVFLGTVLLSWASVAALRRIPAVARVI
jgi:peptidoglycan/LPS O-acetylase OafA/YrhL